MNERSPLSDEQIDDLLRRRSARRTPDALTTAVLESLAAERELQPVRAIRRSGMRPMTLLAAAATIVLVGGALVVGSGVLRPRPAVVPPVPSIDKLAIASPDATTPSPSDLTRPSASPAPVAGPGGTWIRTGSPGADGATVRLLDGRVLAVGGATAELYDPTTGTWSATGRPLSPGVGELTVLPDGRVFAVDELYDPATGTWTATAKPPREILGPLTALRDGRVLMGAQVYDPGSDTWTATGKMVTPRYGYTATLLPDGRVLVADGLIYDTVATDSAELYDPATNSWSATGSMVHSGWGGSAYLLRDGRVFVDEKAHPGEGGIELYDPATGHWTAVPAPAQFVLGKQTVFWSLTPLPDGTVLAVGPDLSTIEVYDPIAGSWTQAASMLPSPDGSYPRHGTPLLDGTVLFTGGSGSQLYVPAGVAPPTGLAPVPSPTPPTPTPSPTPGPSPFPPAAGPVPQGARPWVVTVENRSPKDATLFLSREPFKDMTDLCGAITPDVVPAHTTQKVLFQLPPKGATECWLMIWPGPGADGQFGPTDDWPIPGHLIVGWPSENGDNLATVWAGP